MTTELKIWLEKTMDACANEGGTNFSGELIMYYRTSLQFVQIFSSVIDYFVLLYYLVPLSVRMRQHEPQAMLSLKYYWFT